jgi:hypothetical protein
MFTLEPALEALSDSDSALRGAKDAVVLTETAYLSDEAQETSGPSSDFAVEDNTVCIVGMGQYCADCV